MDAYRHVVVTVPGAGEPRPGDSLQALAAALPGPPGSYHRSDLVLGREIYPRLVNSAPSLPDLIEADWSDLRCAPRSWAGFLERLCHLLTGLPQVRFGWCDAAPAVKTQPAYRDVVAHTCLWTLWPVLLTLIHVVVAPSARPLAAVLEAAVLGGLAWLARSQWRPANRATAAGLTWLGLCLALTGVLWLGGPRWTGLATTLSVRVYGFGWLATALVFVALAAETGLRIGRDAVSWRRGLAGLAIAATPLVLASLLVSCAWALVLNGVQFLGSGPQLEALKGWQQTFAGALGFHLAACEWAMAWATGLTGLLVLGVALYTAGSQRSDRSRRWLALCLGTLPVLVILACLCLLLTSRYLHAPLAARLKDIGSGADASAIYTWSLFRVLPWLLLLATPARLLLATLGDAGFYIMSPEGDEPSTRRACQERLGRLLEFLDRGRYDRIQVVAHGQGSMVALDVLQAAALRHPVVLTTLGSPAGTLYRDLLDWPLDPAALAATEWCNLFHADDLVGGPVGLDGVDAPLPPGGHVGYWSDAVLADRVVQAMRAPLATPSA